MTKSLWAFGRLLWRPGFVVGVIPVAFAATWPVLHSASSLTDEIQFNANTLASIFWGESIVLMGALGASLGTVARSAHQPLFAYTVPSLRARVLSGKLAVGSLFAILLAFAILALAGPIAAIGVFGCGLLFFAMGGCFADKTMPQSLIIGTGIALTAAVLQMHQVRTLFESAPVAAPIGAIVVAIGLFWREWSPESARSRALAQPVPEGYVFLPAFRRVFSQRSDFQSSVWDASPSSGRLADWMQAARYEVFGAQKRGWLKWVTMAVFTYCGFSYALGNAGFAALVGMQLTAMSGHRLLGGWVYPVTRKRRADVLFLGGLVDSTGFYLMATLLMLGLQHSGLPRLTWFATTDAHPDTLLATFGGGFMWVPVVQWADITRPGPKRKARKASWWLARFFVHSLIGLVLALLTVVALTRIARISVGTSVATGVGLLIAIHAIYWRLLRWHFATHDLI